MYVGFMDLEKAYDRINREVLRQVMRMYDVDGKLLNGIKRMYVNSLACVRAKGGENEYLVYHVPLTLQCIYGHRNVGGENGDGEEGKEQRLPGLL